MSIALRILVADRRGAAAVPTLIEILRRQRAAASFVAPPRWLPALCTAVEAGHEAGLLGSEPPAWWARRPTDPTHAETSLRAAFAAYQKTFDAPPCLLACTDARLTAHSLRLSQRLGFAYASETRGRHPFVPVWSGEIVRCPQFPVTLPMFEELADSPRADWSPLGAQLLAMTAETPGRDQVFALIASPSLVARIAALEELLTGWREQGHELVSIRALAAGVDVDKLPRHEVVFGRVTGQAGALPLQGEEFLSEWRSSP